MGKKVKTFFLDFRNSLIPQPSFYKRLLRVSFSHSVSYFITLVFFLNTVFLILFITKVNPVRLTEIKNSIVNELNAFPENLTIHINDGYIMSSTNRPYFFWITHEHKKLLLGVVDEDATPEKINEYGSFFLITNNMFVFNKNKLPIIINSLSLAEVNETINREWTKSLAIFINQIYPFALVLFFLISLAVIPIVTLFINGIIIMLGSLGSFILFKFFTKKHTFKKTLQITLHSSSLPLIILGISSLLNPTIHNLRIPLFLLIVIFSICALYEAYIDRDDRPIQRNYAHKNLR